MIRSFAGAPIIAVEVASRGNTPDELEFKKELYLANGAHEVWIVDDKTRTVERYGRRARDTEVTDGVALFYPCLSVRMLYARSWRPSVVVKSLEDLLQQRTQILERITQLGDFRRGSITSTTGRCGRPTCRCHQPNQPPHGPTVRLTFKAHGTTVTESLPTAAVVRKTEREIAEFRKFEQPTRDLLDVNAQICRLRPVEQAAETPQEENGRSYP